MDFKAIALHEKSQAQTTLADRFCLEGILGMTGDSNRNQSSGCLEQWKKSEGWKEDMRELGVGDENMFLELRHFSKASGLRQYGQFLAFLVCK